MQPVPAAARVVCVAAVLVLSGSLAGCYYPYGYYPYGYYPNGYYAYQTVPASVTQQEVPVGPNGQQAPQNAQTAPAWIAAPAPPVYVAPAYYPAYPAYPAYAPYPYAAYPGWYGWPGWGGPSLSRWPRVARRWWRPPRALIESATEACRSHRSTGRME